MPQGISCKAAPPEISCAFCFEAEAAELKRLGGENCGMCDADCAPRPPRKNFLFSEAPGYVHERNTSSCELGFVSFGDPGRMEALCNLFP